MSVLDPTAQAVVDRLQAKGRGQVGALMRHYLPKLPSMLAGRPIGFSADMSFFDDKLLALEPAQSELLYMLARSAHARLAVEFGTSFGVSTIHLAAAARDAGVGGRVIGTELVPAKIAAARRNLADAGLGAYVDILEGDARQTLCKLTEPVDLLLLDGWPALAMEVLTTVEPRLAQGALVIVDNVGQFPADLRAVVDHFAASPAYRTSRLPLRGGTIVAIRG